MELGAAVTCESGSVSRVVRVASLHMPTIYLRKHVLSSTICQPGEETLQGLTNARVSLYWRYAEAKDWPSTLVPWLSVHRRPAQVDRASVGLGLMDEKERHARADYWDPVAVAERRSDALVAVAVAEMGAAAKRPQRPKHVYAGFRCLTCKRSESACRADVVNGR